MSHQEIIANSVLLTHLKEVPVSDVVVVVQVAEKLPGRCRKERRGQNDVITLVVTGLWRRGVADVRSMVL